MVGLLSVYAKALLRVGDKSFLETSHNTLKVFYAADSKHGDFVFAGLDIHDRKGHYEADMGTYLENMTFDREETFASFSSNRATLAWVVYGRPDICYLTARLAQVTKDQLGAEPQKYLAMVKKIHKSLVC